MEKVLGKGSERLWAGVILAAAVIVGVWLLIVVPQWGNIRPASGVATGDQALAARNAAFAVGVVALVAVWSLVSVLHGKFTLTGIFTGSDGRPSTSQFQFVVWTAVVIFSYAALFAARTFRGHNEALYSIPQNLLVAMGFSVTTVVAAKVITMSKLADGDLVKTTNVGPDGKPINKDEAGLDRLVTSDDGNVDFSKVQILAWTLVAMVVYLFHAGSAIWTVVMPNGLTNVIQCTGDLIPSVKALCDAAALPDIDTSLMVLMGLGHGTYLGNKLITTTTPALTGVTPQQGDETTVITLSGSSLGDSQGGSLVLIDHMAADVAFESNGWSTAKIKFKLPTRHPDGTPWLGHVAAPAKLSVQVNGTESNSQDFTYQEDASGPLRIPDQVPPLATKDRPYEYPLVAFGGTSPYTWKWAGQQDGLSLDGATGKVSGPAKTAGSYSVVVGVEDRAGIKAERTLVFTVKDG